jgi:hypothetical protein
LSGGRGGGQREEGEGIHFECWWLIRVLK